MSLAKIDKLARMANQIADAQSGLPPDDAGRAVASHIRKFWTPKMIAETAEAFGRQRIALNETAARGFAMLTQQSTSAR